jgi:glycosyltransferase involved in cell wall biosynthesis
MTGVPTVSINVPLYNGIEFLSETLDTVLAQTYLYWDLTIGVNGHGEDGNAIHKQVLEIVRSKGDPRLHVVNYTFQGAAETHNALAKQAKGEWIACIDADDHWHPKKLETQMTVVRVYPFVDVIGTWCQYFGEFQGSPQIPMGLIDQDQFKNENPCINSSILMKKSLVDFVNRCNLYDYDLWIRLSKQGKIFYNIPEYLTFHRVYKGSYFNASKKQDPVALRKYHFG